MNYPVILTLLLGAISTALTASPLQAQIGSSQTELSTIIKDKQQVQQAAQQTQQRIVNLDEQSQQASNEYRALLRENAVLTAYNQQLETQLQQQQQLRARLQASMASVRETRMELMPMMTEMVAVLNAFVSNDMPFLWQERQLRLAELKRLLADTNVSVADKYRRILEAYQIETEYGDTIETWQAQLPLADSEKTVQLVRVGRVALYYLSLDNNLGGYWDNQHRQWLPLPASWLANVQQIQQLAANKIAPSLLDIPLLSTIQEVQ